MLASIVSGDTSRMMSSREELCMICSKCNRRGLRSDGQGQGVVSLRVVLADGREVGGPWRSGVALAHAEASDSAEVLAAPLLPLQR